MKDWKRKINRLIVRFAEWSGWLMSVDKNRIESFLNTPDKLLELFSRPNVRKILIVFDKKKRMGFREIGQLESANGNELLRDLNCLQEAKLVDVVVAPHQDFNTYFLTVDGLKAVRTLKGFLAA